MNENPLVSVIIPSFNHCDYIERAINSVLNQTYTNVELIVIDDGSTDGSVEFVKGLSSILRFRLVLQQNAGVSKTLNRGIVEFSKGEFICGLASDDYFHPEKIAEQIAALRQNKRSEFAYTQATEFDSDTDEPLRIFPRKDFSGCVLNRIFLRQPYAGGSTIFSRSLYDRVGGFDETLRAEDWDFSIRCAAQTEFTAVSRPLFYYRSHVSNTMKVLDRRSIFFEKAKILAKNYFLVTPRVWFFSMTFNFFYDHLHNLLKFLHIRKVLN